MPETVEAFVLCGGLGTRLRATIGERQKATVAVAGRPFLTHLLALLRAAGFTRATLCTGYQSADVEALGAEWGGLALRYSRETAPQGTAGAVRDAVAGTAAERLLVLNGDSFCGCDLGALLAAHRAASAGAATLVATAVPDVARYGALELADDDRVLGFGEKAGRSGAGWINAGIYLLDRTVLSSCPADRAVSLEREVLPALATAGRLHALRAAGPFIDIGTPETLAAAEDFFRAL